MLIRDIAELAAKEAVERTANNMHDAIDYSVDKVYLAARQLAKLEERVRAPLSALASIIKR
jgi:hypothetical protein